MVKGPVFAVALLCNLAVVFTLNQLYQSLEPLAPLVQFG
jgi:hypothetical protein